MQAILSTSMEGAATPSPAASQGGEVEPTAKAPGLADLAANSLSSYFAPTAKTRLARGERMQVKARRLVLSGAVAYLIDWEPPPGSS